MPPARVHRLHAASVKLAGRYNPPGFHDTRIDVFCYLVVAGSTVVLVDTGVGEGNSYVDRVFEPRRTPLARELDRCGFLAGDVDAVVNSHLHFDHCGNNRLFPHAEIFVQARELAAAQAPRYTVMEWFDGNGARLHPVSGEADLCEGVRLLPTPGHTPGHQSVLVGGSILIAAQAAFTADEFRRGGDAEVQAHEGLQRQYLDSIARLKSVAAREVLFSHDRSVVSL